MRIGILGAMHLKLAATLAQSGAQTYLIETDPHNRQRIKEMVDQANASVIVCATAPVDLDVLFADETLEGCDATRVALDWRNGDPSLHILDGPGADPIFEWAGEVPVALRKMSAILLKRPAGTPPLSFQALAVLCQQAEGLALAGAVPWEVDAVALTCGAQIGPYAFLDWFGLHTALMALNTLPRPMALPLITRAVAEGRLGREIGVGWFRYPGGDGPVEDPLIEDLAADEAHFKGIPQTWPTPTEAYAQLCDALLEATPDPQRSAEWRCVLSALGVVPQPVS